MHIIKYNECIKNCYYDNMFFIKNNNNVNSNGSLNLYLMIMIMLII